MTRIALAAALAVAFASSALAGHCPIDMKEIDAALAKDPQLSAEQLANVKRLRAAGEAQHNGGKHGDSVKTLAEAKKILGIK